MGYKHLSVKTCWIEIWWRNDKDKRMLYTSWYCETTLVFFIFSFVYCEAFSIRISCHVIPFTNCLKRKQKVLLTLFKALSNAHLNEIFIRIMATEFLFNVFERKDGLLHWKEFKLFFSGPNQFFILYKQKGIYFSTNVYKLPQNFH